MFHRLSGLALGPVLALALAGCQETTQTAARPRVDAPGVPVSVQSISGAPDDVTTNFAGLLGEAAAERKMEIVPGDKPARFRVKGYLTAQPTEDGQTALAFVWDVYDSTKQRAQRVQGVPLAERHLLRPPGPGQHLLRQRRPVIRRVGLGAQHGQPPLVALAPQGLGDAKAGGRGADDQDAVGDGHAFGTFSMVIR